MIKLPDRPSPQPARVRFGTLHRGGRALLPGKKAAPEFDALPDAAEVEALQAWIDALTNL